MSKKSRKETTKQSNKAKAKDAPTIDPEDVSQAINWANDAESSPEFVRNVILNLQVLQSEGERGQAAAKRAVEAMARAMGLLPSSEKVPPQPRPKADIELPHFEHNELEELKASEKELKSLLRFVSRRHKEVQRKITENLKSSAKVYDQKADAPEKSHSECILGGTSGGKTNTSAEPRYAESEKTAAMGEGTLVKKFERTRRDLILGRCDKLIGLETRFNPFTGVTLYPDLSLVGPPGFQITWRAIANVIVLSFGMALPLSRIEKLFGKDGFSRSQTSQYCAYVAERLLPVYFAMTEELAQCEVLMGDDCVSRITELTRYKRDLRLWKKTRDAQEKNHLPKWLEKNPEPLEPWSKLSSESLTARLESELDFKFAHQKVEGGVKTKLHTSVLSGEVTLGDPKSRVIVYRSHLGSVGNLADRVLLSRSKKKNKLVFIGDLSSSNRVHDPAVLEHIEVTYAGCTSHARRPFKRYLERDEDNCLEALDQFRALYQIEDIIDRRAPSMRAQMRADTVNGSISIWNELTVLCEAMSEKWSPATELGEGVRYLMSNFDALTRYCSDPRLSLSNDLSERLLRYEKLMDRSSFGRETIEGRARYDIIRSFFQTSIFAGIDPTYALLEVLITPAEKVSASPSDYTPHAIAKRHKENPARQAQIHTILTTSQLGPLIEYRVADPNMPVPEMDV